MTKDDVRAFNDRDSIIDLSDRTYRRGITYSLFVLGAVAAANLLFLTFVVLMQNWRNFDGDPVSPPRAFPLYWITVIVLALTTAGMMWNVRRERRDGRRFPAGVVLATLSFVPLLFGIAMLTVNL